MPRLKVNNCVFYREYNISKEKINYGDAWRQGSWTQEQLVKDIEQELLDNPSAPYIPPYQTHADLYDRMKNKKHWSDLYKKIKHSLMRFYTKEFNSAFEDDIIGKSTDKFLDDVASQIKKDGSFFPNATELKEVDGKIVVLQGDK